MVFGVVASSDPDAQLNRMNKVVAYLSEELNMPVKYVKGTNYAAVIEAMKTEKVDITSTGSFSYLIASAKARAEPLVATRYRNGGMNNYGSIIFTRAESNIQSMDDVKARSGELSIAFSDPASTSGYLYPMSYLRSIGLEPGEKFKERLFAGGHTAGIFSALAGKVDLACTTSSSLEKLARAGRIEPNSYRVL
ncbi:MAG: phosphate/phosphite/phosphonate ABC transporter substrate-binding protein [Bacteroidota bacterium]